MFYRFNKKATLKEFVGSKKRARRLNKYYEKSLLESDEKSILKKDYKQKDLLKLSDLELKVKEVKSKYNKEDYVGIDIEWLSKDTNKPVCWVTVDKFPASDGYYWFGSLEVDKEYRGHGLGKQVLEFIKNKYKAGALAVAKDNEIAIKLYKSCGFKELERKDPNNKYYYLYYTPNRQKVLKESTNFLLEDNMSRRFYLKEDYDYNVGDDNFMKRLVRWVSEKVAKDAYSFECLEYVNGWGTSKQPIYTNRQTGRHFTVPDHEYYWDGESYVAPEVVWNSRTREYDLVEEERHDWRSYDEWRAYPLSLFDIIGPLLSESDKRYVKEMIADKLNMPVEDVDLYAFIDENGAPYLEYKGYDLYAIR